jgi:hypothetical protein
MILINAASIHNNPYLLHNKHIHSTTRHQQPRALTSSRVEQRGPGYTGKDSVRTQPGTVSVRACFPRERQHITTVATTRATLNGLPVVTPDLVPQACCKQMHPAARSLPARNAKCPHPKGRRRFLRCYPGSAELPTCQ